MNSYVNKLKIAVINRDLKKIEEIIALNPEFSTVEEAKEIQAYIKEAIKILEEEKKSLSIQMKKIKDLQKFNNQNLAHKTFEFKA